MRGDVAVAFAVAALLAGCVQTSRVDDTITTGKLTTARKAVAVMRLGSASPACVHVAVLLGTREGEGYRRGAVVTVANVRSLSETQVAEVELEPGEHHVIGYKCVADKGATAIADPSTTNGLFRTSFAHFTVQQGEIVNVGYFHFGASRHGRSLFGRAVRTDIEISEWPLNEIERFRTARPQVFAQMITRHMKLNQEITPEQAAATCETWAKLLAERKIQTLPPECGGTAQKVRRVTAGAP